MADATQWIELLAGIKTVFEATKAGINLASTLEKYRRDPETIQEADRVSRVFSTYSEAEIQHLIELVEGCRTRFIAQGSGAARAQCLCSVLREAMEGNGGTLPLIDDWENIYQTLGCRRSEG